MTVTGLSDDLPDGDVDYTITTTASSIDPSYNGIAVADVGVTNLNIVRGVTVTPTSGLTTTENGGSATFTVVVISQPPADVTIALTSSNPSEGTVAPSALTFTSSNWNITQVVTVTGVSDNLNDGDVAYAITTTFGDDGFLYG